MALRRMRLLLGRWDRASYAGGVLLPWCMVFCLTVVSRLGMLGVRLAFRLAVAGGVLRLVCS